MPRLLFKKCGTAIWISHLDLMRLFQRAFKRAGLPLKHTQGFNPRPSVSIALPLSVGTESICELLDFELDGMELTCKEICERLNKTLVNGVSVLDVYEGGRKIRDIMLMECMLTLSYDHGIPAGAEEKFTNLFSQESLLVPKKTKNNGIVEQDIIPMIRQLCIRRTEEKTLELTALICCQNPTLNPSQLTQAIALHLPDYIPNHVACKRIEIYDKDQVIFR